MKHSWVFASLLLVLSEGTYFLHGEEPCSAALRELKLPVKLKTRGKPRRARWEQVDKMLTELRKNLQGATCEFKFEEIFKTDKEKLYLPVTNNLVRTVSEAALEGVPIFNQSGERIGEYIGRVTYNRSGGLYVTKSYTLYYFQFRDTQGKIQSTGNRLLLDDYLVRWSDIKNRVAVNFFE
ncbi:hypothetical protein MYX65_05390 [Acidobacteria bacterium AH-259-L09]|nr:hypothetical protein [Acidobacteria bacterium AH-259-L09]